MESISEVRNAIPRGISPVTPAAPVLTPPAAGIAVIFLD
jgi:hypothetical protein